MTIVRGCAAVIQNQQMAMVAMSKNAAGPTVINNNNNNNNGGGGAPVTVVNVQAQGPKGPVGVVIGGKGFVTASSWWCVFCIILDVWMTSVCDVNHRDDPCDRGGGDAVLVQSQPF
jgi:hypothetical protein